MSCELFAKLNRDLHSLQDVLEILGQANIDVLDISAKPSLDRRYYFLRLIVDSEPNQLVGLLDNSNGLEQVSITQQLASSQSMR